MKRRSLKFEPGYMGPGRMSLKLGHHGGSQNDLKGSCPFWREGYGGHHVWRGDMYLIPYLNGGSISRMGSWEEGVHIIPEGISKTGEKRKVDRAREGEQGQYWETGK
jgi:hypothetical protein